MSNNGLATIEQPGQLQHAAPSKRLTADTQAVAHMISQVREMQASVLRKDIDYGVIPGTGNKPCLLKPGAESLLAAFNLGIGKPDVQVIPIEHEVHGHREYQIELPAVNRATGETVGYGMGSCSTLEKKYRYRQAERVCPSCGKSAIIKGKTEYGGGWLCYKNKGGCGAKFGDRAPEIVNQETGQIENPNPADFYNTCLKMAKKRALVDLALTTTAASGVFTQDVDEDYEAPHFEEVVAEQRRFNMETPSVINDGTPPPAPAETPALVEEPIQTVDITLGEAVAEHGIPGAEKYTLLTTHDSLRGANMARKSPAVLLYPGTWPVDAPLPARYKVTLKATGNMTPSKRNHIWQVMKQNGVPLVSLLEQPATAEGGGE